MITIVIIYIENSIQIYIFTHNKYEHDKYLHNFTIDLETPILIFRVFT